MIDAFLERAGWGAAEHHPLASDASARRYLRLYRGAERAVLMQAPMTTPGDQASFDAFRAIGAHLRFLGLSAPLEISFDRAAGFMLMEDLGDATLSRLLATDQTTARLAYDVTNALLESLARAEAPQNLARPDADEMAAMAALTFDALPGSDALRNRLLPGVAGALRTHAAGDTVLSLRDVHADNLMWLPDREGIARIGLLDFQDALLLPAGYDLASLVDDPRREVPEDWRTKLIEQSSSSEARINALSLQRNLRILGIFNRLAGAGKPVYRGFIPRTRFLLRRAAEAFPELHAPVDELLDRTSGWSKP